MRTANLLAAALALTIAPVSLAAPKPPEVIKPTITKMVEKRVVHVVPRDENSFSFDNPEFLITLDPNLPDGLRIADVSEPSAFSAKDNTGASIKLPEDTSTFTSPRVELTSTFDDEPQTITLRCAPSTRGATTFSIATTFNAVVYSGTQDIPITVSNAESPVPAKVFGASEAITAQLVTNHGQHAITFKPGAVRGLIESITVDGEESASSMWSDDSVTYFLESGLGSSAECVITVRTNAAAVPVMVNIKDHPLP